MFVRLLQSNEHLFFEFIDKHNILKNDYQLAINSHAVLYVPLASQ
jgi:hypothetical protein